MLLIALVAEPVADRLRLPFGVVLVAVGFAGSEALVAMGVDTGLRWQGFTDLILYLFLPVLVFESALRLDVRETLQDLAPILYLAVPLFLVSACLIGAAVYFGIHHPTGFPWPVALLTGTLLSATDAGAVAALFQRTGTEPRLLRILDGEGLFSDATAIVLFGLLLSLATASIDEVQIPAAVLEFLRIFFGGLVTGILIGGLGVGLMFTFTGAIPRAIISLAAALFSTHLAEQLFQVSGVMAVLAAGLVVGEANRRFCRVAFLDTLWELNAYVANALIFLLVGASITLGMFTDQWLAMLIGIGAVLLARAVLIYGLLPPLCRAPGIAPLGARQRTVLYWAGLRGAVTLALALSLPFELEAWYTVQSIAYGVVLFTLFLQAPTVPVLLKRLRDRAG
jgi:CPA1 family monovalent cation:H+ antiporter